MGILHSNIRLDSMQILNGSIWNNDMFVYNLIIVIDIFRLIRADENADPNAQVEFYKYPPIRDSAPDTRTLSRRAAN